MTAWGSMLQVQVRLDSRKLTPAAGFYKHIPTIVSGRTSAPARRPSHRVRKTRSMRTFGSLMHEDDDL